MGIAAAQRTSFVSAHASASAVSLARLAFEATSKTLRSSLSSSSSSSDDDWMREQSVGAPQLSKYHESSRSCSYTALRKYHESSRSCSYTALTVKACPSGRPARISSRSRA